jgi:signal transduction histidine kinase
MAGIDSSPRELESNAGTDRTLLFEEILERLPYGVIVVDHGLQIQFVNRVAAELLDEIAVGQPLAEQWAEFAVRDYAARLFGRDAEPGSKLAALAERTLRVNGLSAPRSETAILLLEDVTERERTRDAERRFVENAAHELRTPVAAIVSVVEILERGAKDVPETRDRFFAHLSAHSARLVRLMTSLLTLARVQNGYEEPRLELVPLRPFLEDLARTLTPRAGVTVSVDAPEEVVALADRDLLTLVVSNVGSNAVTNTHEGEIVFEARGSPGSVELEIRDTGSGMDQAERDAALDRFHRGGDSAGFGLGLAIAAEAVRELGGTLCLEAAAGGGTRVLIALRGASIVS